MITPPGGLLRGSGDRVAGVSGPSMSRRSVLRAGGAAGVLGSPLLAGCDLDPRSTSPPSAGPSSDPDQHIVEEARAELTGLLTHLSPRGRTASLHSCHRAQLLALGGRPPRRRRSLLPEAALKARESAAADRFETWAVACHDGDLARVLASVAAGIRMQPELRGAS
jgi:hypothetical protein